jgi:hypothetical protein
MVADDPRTRDALQAVAFGRAVTPEDQAAAARALQALRELDDQASAGRTGAVAIPAVPVLGGARRAVAAGTGVASGPVMIEVVDDSQALRDRAWRGGPNRVMESLRRFWVVPVVVASLAVGAVGGVVATRVAEKPSASLAPAALTTAPADSGGPTDSAEQGDAAAAESALTVPPDANYLEPDPIVTDPATAAAALASAEDWLNQPQRPVDIFPNVQSLVTLGADPNSTHFVMTEGAMGLWVLRGKADSLCLAMVPRAGGGFGMGCSPENEFSTVGVSIGLDGTFARWDGNGVSIVPDVGPTGG